MSKLDDAVAALATAAQANHDAVSAEIAALKAAIAAGDQTAANAAADKIMTIVGNINNDTQALTASQQPDNPAPPAAGG